jgi:two-component system, NarL family, nitrate/nitrite response regulator NarL
MAQTIDIALVTDNVIMADGIRIWTSLAGEIRVVAVTATVDGLLCASSAVPEVVLLDLCRHDRLEPAAEVRRLTAGRRCRVVALGTRHDLDAIVAACAVGARGGVTREHTLVELARAIRGVAAGHVVGLPPEITPARTGGPHPRRPPLSERERAVLIAYASGMTLETAARHVGVSPDTAKTYLRRVKAKYQAAGRPAYTKVELARRLWEEGAVIPHRDG